MSGYRPVKRVIVDEFKAVTCEDCDTALPGTDEAAMTHARNAPHKVTVRSFKVETIEKADLT